MGYSSMGNQYVTKVCKCEVKDRGNWFRDGSLVCCHICGNQWYTQAKYKATLKTRKEFFAERHKPS